MNAVPASRIRNLNDHPPANGGRFVLYWMIAQRRLSYNFSLQRAAELARRLDRPLLILEALRCDYRWASDRLHRFVLDGMLERQQLEGCFSYVEPECGAGKGLLAALAKGACAVVTDDYPCFFLPRMVQAAATQVDVSFEAVDANGLLPIRAAACTYPTAYAFRRFMQKQAADCLAQSPMAEPLKGITMARPGLVPEGVFKRWPMAPADAQKLSDLPIDHSVPPTLKGGSEAARQRLEAFIKRGLPHYAGNRNDVSDDPSSGLSPYLHFGQIGTHEVLERVAKAEKWSPRRLAEKANGRRSGFWGMSEGAEAFLDQLITWRELGYHFCAREPGYDRFESLPAWARKTLDDQRGEPRKHLYSLAQFERAGTHDPIWNAAQRQLVREGVMHNYLRMLWGKKILEWSASPQAALEVMIELNNKYAIDGRDPNSYSGIFWCLGRFDRPWGPRRPVFGSVRYMSSDSTARKLDLKGYLERYAT